MTNIKYCLFKEIYFKCQNIQLNRFNSLCHVNVFPSMVENHYIKFLGTEVKFLHLESRMKCSRS